MVPMISSRFSESTLPSSRKRSLGRSPLKRVPFAGASLLPARSPGTCRPAGSCCDVEGAICLDVRVGEQADADRDVAIILIADLLDLPDLDALGPDFLALLQAGDLGELDRERIEVRPDDGAALDHDRHVSTLTMAPRKIAPTRKSRRVCIVVLLLRACARLLRARYRPHGIAAYELRHDGVRARLDLVRRAGRDDAALVDQWRCDRRWRRRSPCRA